MSKEQDLEAACKELVEAWHKPKELSPSIAKIAKILNPPVEHIMSVQKHSISGVYIHCLCGWQSAALVSPSPGLLYEEAKKHLAATR